ncbi:MAG: YcaQ family DNA glycosylase [Clostridia bacterium]|nr:YcaQ family DNA glycosylase [Clostridia bacterium]
MMTITIEQARRFMLMKNGLLGAPALKGKDGVLEYVLQAGCVQFDPVDVCGKSHELALLARVKGFSRQMLWDLLYEDRALIDYFDKNMCIMLTQDWPSLGYMREHFRTHTRSRAEVEKVAGELMKIIRREGCVSSQELMAILRREQMAEAGVDVDEKVDWPWGATSIARAALETLYFRGDLVIHHKTGTVKSYAIAADCLPQELLTAPSPFQNERERQMWQVMRRIGAVGMLWNAASDAWLGVDGLNAQARNEVFQSLMEVQVITPVQVEGLPRPLYVLTEDLPLLDRCSQPVTQDRTVRLLPPLDCMLWDRKLIMALFGFNYKWEIYTPEDQRRYGYYVLPVLCGERFAGRVEPVCDRGSNTLVIRHFWPEEGVTVNDRFLWALEDALRRLARFLELGNVVWAQDWLVV